MTATDDKQQQLDLSARTLASKKMRMTLACVRCRSKKVKCDTKHPSCTRCHQAKASCSYEGSPSQIDIYNIIRLNDTVSTLQERIQYLESTIGDIHHPTSKSVANHLCVEARTTTPLTTVSPNRQGMVSSTTSKSTPSVPSLEHPPHQWSLSLTSTGLRIDTNVVSLPNLYNILLSGVSQLDLNQHDNPTTTTGGDNPLSFLENSTSSSLDHSMKMGHHLQQQHHHHHHQQQKREQPSSSEVDLADNSIIMVQPKTPLWRSKITTFPLYSTWSTDNSSSSKQSQYSSSSLNNLSPMDRFHLHQRHHHHHHGTTATTATAATVLLDDMIDIYSECFLCLPETGYGGTINQRYQQGTLDPLLANAIFAWSARHGAIYHDLCRGQDPNQVGECYFKVAKDLLKDRFTTPSIDTLHGVLIMYIYAVGRPSRGHSNDGDDEQQQPTTTTSASEAYIFLGLAIRMCLDLKLHKEKKDDNEDDVDNNNNDNNKRMKMERDRRFFWVLYFLETLCTLHSDRPFSLPCEDEITAAYPDVLGNETGEQQWRTEFMMKRFRITRIYRDIIQRTSQPTPLPLSCISELDANLCEWYDQLPDYMQYQQGDVQRRKWKSTSFREQACIKLNFEYHFQRCQLYAVFLKRKLDDKDDDGGGTLFGGDGSNQQQQQQQQQQQDGAGSNNIDPEEHASTTVPNTMEDKAKKICVTSATMTVELLECWNQLQQRWCHFSLESLMMAVYIFEMLLRDEDEVEQTKAQLATILTILQASPIQHHRHVIIVTTRIQELLHIKCGGEDESNLEWAPRIGMTAAATTATPTLGIENREQQQQQHISHQHLGASTTNYSMDIYNSFLPTQHPSGMFGTHYGDLPFSDFLYNPVMQLPTSTFEAYNTTTATTTSVYHQQQEQQWTTTAQLPSISTAMLPLMQTYSVPPPPLTNVVSLSSSSSSSYSAPLSDDYSTRPGAAAASAASFWPTTTATTSTLHQPTYAANGSAIFESITLQQHGHHYPSNQDQYTAQHNGPYSTDQR